MKYKMSYQNINIVHTTYCPHCRVVTNLSVSVALQTIPRPDGKTRMLISRTYHCESCYSFIRSENDVSSPTGDGESDFSGLLV